MSTRIRTRAPRQWSFGDEVPNTPFHDLDTKFHQAFWAKKGRGPVPANSQIFGGTR